MPCFWQVNANSYPKSTTSTPVIRRRHAHDGIRKITECPPSKCPRYASLRAMKERKRGCQGVLFMYPHDHPFIPRQKVISERELKHQMKRVRNPDSIGGVFTMPLLRSFMPDVFGLSGRSPPAAASSRSLRAAF
jgi:hypothetical protein